MMQQDDLFVVASADGAAVMYSELLLTARRMLKKAQARRWSCLVNEEVEFFKAYERIAEHEQREQCNAVELARRERVHEEVKAHVEQTRRLLSLRKSELAEQMSRTGSDTGREKSVRLHFPGADAEPHMEALTLVH